VAGAGLAKRRQAVQAEEETSRSWSSWTHRRSPRVVEAAAREKGKEGIALVAVVLEWRRIFFDTIDTKKKWLCERTA
jgi:hypothetical protein